MMQHPVLARVCTKLELPARTCTSQERVCAHAGADNAQCAPQRYASCQAAVDGHMMALDDVMIKQQSQCWVVASPDTASGWHGYPFVLNLLHLAHPTFAQTIRHIGYNQLLQVCGRRAPQSCASQPALMSDCFWCRVA
jgi:hypothetical protein